MRSLVKVLVLTMLVGFVGAQFLPDVIHVPKRWPPRLPRIEFVHERAFTPPAVSADVPVVPTPDTTALALPPVAAAPSLDAAEAARHAKRAVRHAKPKAKPRALPEEDGSWFSSEPTAMIVPVRITTQIELSGSSREIPTPAAPEITNGEEWPMVCGEVVDANGARQWMAPTAHRSTDITERTDKNGRFPASPVRKLTLLIGADAATASATRSRSTAGQRRSRHAPRAPAALLRAGRTPCAMGYAGGRSAWLERARTIPTSAEAPPCHRPRIARTLRYC
jgi:hypothetical protein